MTSFSGSFALNIIQALEDVTYSSSHLCFVCNWLMLLTDVEMM